jgi:Spy/CpxP family protein refolding chaperone
MQAHHHLELRLASVALMLCLVALAPRSASGQMMLGPDPEMMDNGMSGGPDLPLFLRSANLAPDQRAHVKQILDGNHPAFARLFGQIHQQRQQLDDRLFAAGPVDPAEMARASQQLAQVQGQLAQLELQTMLQIRALLTPAQLTRVADFHRKLESLHQQMRALMQENMPPGPFAGPPGGPHPPRPPMGPPGSPMGPMPGD